MNVIENHSRASANGVRSPTCAGPFGLMTPPSFGFQAMQELHSDRSIAWLALVEPEGFQQGVLNWAHALVRVSGTDPRFLLVDLRYVAACGPFSGSVSLPSFSGPLVNQKKHLKWRSV
jgi:hypothetical protein